MKARVMSLKCRTHGRIEPCFICDYEHEMEENALAAQRKWRAIMLAMAAAVFLLFTLPNC